MTPTPVTAETLLEGALYSLQEAGRLVVDAATAFDNKSHVLGAASAAFAFELIGQHKILLELWEKAVNGETVTVDDVAASTRDHVERQKAGQGSLTMRTDRNSGLGKLLAARNAARCRLVHGVPNGIRTRVRP